MIRIEIISLIVTVLDRWQVHTMSCDLVQVTILQIEVVRDVGHPISSDNGLISQKL